jgi:DNA-binding XRE family transcriptional regulator
MRKNITGPIVIRGARYDSASAAAARDLGVSTQTVVNARQRGTLESVGLGLHGNRDGGSNRRPVTIQGHTYESRKDAARALGVSQSQLASFLSIAEHLKIKY